MEFKFTVRGDNITRENENSFVEGNKNSYEAVFDFDRQWDDVAKLCVVETDKGEVYRLPVIEGRCTLPVFGKGNFKIGVMGAETYAGDVIEEGIVISTNMHRCEVVSGAATKEANTELNSAAEVWMRYLSQMEDNREAAEEAAESAKESAKSAVKVAEMTVSAENLPEGSTATVVKTEDTDTLHLTFGIPKGEKGPKGDKGEQGERGTDGKNGVDGKDGVDGKTPVKGVDYFTPEDIAGLNIPVIDTELDENSDNAIANKVVARYLNEYDERISNNANDIAEIGQTQEESLGYFGNEIDKLTTTTKEHEERITANATDIGELANQINDVRNECATKEYVEDYVNEAILGGAW